MKLLAIDTATEACSAAISIDGEILSLFEVCPQQHSQRILPMVDDLLKQASIKVADLDCLAFGRGPGSFTGVRIATGILQGLSLGTGLPVVGVSTLAAMAQQVISEQQQQKVAVAIDARMSEVYWGCFENIDEYPCLIGQEQVLPPEHAAKILPFTGIPFGVAGTGWQAYPEIGTLLSNTELITVSYPDAKYMLPIALAAAKQGKAMEIEDIMPVYLRDKVSWKKLPGK
jgi:tRNA threonylcarbamoyladenosine biosynthesis protein TsaB